MVGGCHQEVAGLLSLHRVQVAISGKEVAFTWLLLNKHLQPMLTGFYLLTLSKDLYFQLQLSFVLCTNAQEVETMLVVHGILCVVVLSFSYFKEFVV